MEALGVTRDTLLGAMGRPYSVEAVVAWRRGDRPRVFLSLALLDADRLQSVS